MKRPTYYEAIEYALMNTVGEELKQGWEAQRRVASKEWLQSVRDLACSVPFDMINFSYGKNAEDAFLQILKVLYYGEAYYATKRGSDRRASRVYLYRLIKEAK